MATMKTVRPSKRGSGAAVTRIAPVIALGGLGGGSDVMTGRPAASRFSRDVGVMCAIVAIDCRLGAPFRIIRSGMTSVADWVGPPALSLSEISGPAEKRAGREPSGITGAVRSEGFNPTTAAVRLAEGPSSSSGGDGWAGLLGGGAKIFGCGLAGSVILDGTPPSKVEFCGG